VPINFFYEEEKFKIFSESNIEIWIKKVLGFENKRLGEISYQFVSDKEIRNLNSEFLNHDYFTDIITFDNSLVNIINGDIIISFDTVQFNANKFKVSIENELYRVIIHGVMHLCGYNDSSENEKNVMRNKEDYYLSYLEKL
jgi:rRNA maturation RNase YbeY